MPGPAASMRPCPHCAGRFGDGGGETCRVHDRTGRRTFGGGGADHQPPQVVRAAGLRSGPARALAAEGLRPDHRADLVAVDVDVAGPNPVHDVLHAVVDAGVQSEREAVAGRVDGIDDRLDAVRVVGGDVQHRSEDFLLEPFDAVDPQHRGRHESSVVRRREPLQRSALPLRATAVRFDALPRLVVDDRADVGGEVPGIADAKLVDRAEQHLENPLLDLALDVEDAQRRAPLAGALERGGDDVAHRLLGQRGGVDDHRVQPAGLRDERGIGREVLGHRVVDEPGSRGRYREAHAVDARVACERRPHRRAVAGQHLHDLARDARCVHESDRPRRDERRLLGRLGDDRIAGRQRGEDLPGEDRQREVPRRDARDDASWSSLPASALA